MVHNGIEYGDIQLICEAYHLLKTILGLSNEELKAVSSLCLFLFCIPFCFHLD
jgi:6-phosphogluconate dehydrogenase